MHKDSRGFMKSRYLRLRVIGLCLLLTLAISSIGVSAAQENTTSSMLAPKVIDVWPLPGVALGRTEPLTITFDWPMDEDSVAAAFNINPPLEGELTWTDARTVNFSPTGGWPIAQTYTVTIGSEATSSKAVTLAESYIFDVITTRPLAVALVSPENGVEEVPADSRITVSFDRPVVALTSTVDLADLPMPIQITPHIAGTGEWVNTSIFTFTPATFFDAATTYNVTVDEALVATDGAPLTQAFAWSFKTERPRVIGFPLQAGVSVDPETPVTVDFNVPMDQSVTQAAFALQSAEGGTVDGRFLWERNGTVMKFMPSERLNLATTYTVSVGAEAKASTGTDGLREAFSGQFTTMPFPGVERTNPSDGRESFDIEFMNGVYIQFRSQMDIDSFDDLFEISPAPESYTIGSNGAQYVNSINVNFPLAFDTAYTVTLKAGAKDRFGNAIADDYTFTFTTGPINPRGYPIVTGNFMVTGAHRDQTEIAVRVTGNVEMDFEINQVRPADLSLNQFGSYGSGYDSFNYSYIDGVYYESGGAAFARYWTQAFDSAGEQEVPFAVPLASEEGGKLEPGLYAMLVTGPRMLYYDEGNTTLAFALAVSTATVTVKRSHDEMLVWVTDMVTGDPVPNATVTFYNQGSALLSGTTDADGLMHTPLDMIPNEAAGQFSWWRSPASAEGVLITAEAEGVFGAWYSNRESVLSTTRAYLYTDRPIYRPGETVYFRGVLRDRLDVTYTPPDVNSVEVTLGALDNSILRQTVAVTEFGTFSGEFVIPENIELTQHEIQVAWGGSPFDVTYCYSYDPANPPYCETYPGNGISITVADFRIPEYEVSVTPAENGIIQGEPLNALVDAAYYFGGKVSAANVDWRVQFTRGSFSAPGYNYSFYDDSVSISNNEPPISGSGVTDGNGQILLTTTDTAGSTTQFPGVPLNIRAIATVFDQSEQGISAAATVLAHPSDAYVGIGWGNYFGKIDEPYTVNLVSLTPERTPIANQPITVEVVETRWERQTSGQGGWVEKEYPVTDGTVTTDSEGKATYSFTPEKGGSYRVRAITRDALERYSSSSRRVYVPSGERVYWSNPSARAGSSVALIRDQDSYKPGDTAQVIIPIPFESADGGTSGATVLVATERAGIMTTEVLQTTETSITYAVELGDADAPNVFVTAWMVAGLDAEAPQGDPARNPRYASGSVSLVVEPTAKALTVILTPSEELVAPGKNLTLDVQVTDRDGLPVEAEIGLKLTDEAMLDLLPDNAATLLATFYSHQSLNVTTSTSLSALIDILLDAILPGGGMGGGGGGGGGESPNFDVRDDFKVTPLWAAHLVTDAEGRATVDVTMPDNLTRWVADARVVTKDTAIGQVTTTVVSTLPLIARPAVPRFFVVGDRAELATIINNNTGQEQTITARLEATGVTLEDPEEQLVTIAAGGRGRVVWTAVVQDVDVVDLTFFASNQDGSVTDAVKPTLATGPEGTIPVYRYTATDVVGTGGFLGEAGSVTEVVNLPTRVLDNAQGELVITVDPSAAVTTVDALDYLESFEHECVEQTVSRFLPNTVTYRALNDLGIEDADLQANLIRVSEDSINKLLDAQNADGGLGWFPGLRSNSTVSAYALLGLVEAYEANLFDSLNFGVEGGAGGGGGSGGGGGNGSGGGSGGGGEGGSRGGAAGRALNSGDPLTLMNQLKNYVLGDYKGVDVGTPTWELNRQAFILYVLARYDAALEDEVIFDNEFTVSTTLGGLFAQRARLPHEAQAYLLMAFHAIAPDDAAVAALISDLNSSAILSANGAHWEDVERDIYGWGTKTRTNALVLNALTLTQPENPLLPNVVRWLMVARDRKHWTTTQETAWSIMALTDWMIATDELKGDYGYAARFNAEEIADGVVTPQTVRDQETLEIDVVDLLLSDVNQLTLARGEGDGALYYTAYLNLELLADQVDAISRGVEVTREYFNTEGERITQATAGETVTVRLTLNLPQSVSYFVLDDPLPAGLESIDPDLLTNVGADTPTLSRDDSRWYWYYWAFDRTELRDDRTSLYAESLLRGSYVYTYQARAVTPGVYQTRPALGYEFYFPEVYGRTAGQTFTVLERVTE